jgi:hypothetical protein
MIMLSKRNAMVLNSMMLIVGSEMGMLLVRCSSGAFLPRTSAFRMF